MSLVRFISHALNTFTPRIDWNGARHRDGGTEQLGRLLQGFARYPFEYCRGVYEGDVAACCDASWSRTGRIEAFHGRHRVEIMLHRKKLKDILSRCRHRV